MLYIIQLRNIRQDATKQIMLKYLYSIKGYSKKQQPNNNTKNTHTKGSGGRVMVRALDAALPTACKVIYHGGDALIFHMGGYEPR